MSPHVPARTRISISECLLFSNYRSSRGSSQQSSLSLPHALAPPPDILSLQHIFSLSSGDCSAPSYCPAAIATHPVGATPLSLMLSPSPSPPLVEPTASMPSRPPLPLLATPPSFPRAENPRLQRCNCAQEGAEVCLQGTAAEVQLCPRGCRSVPTGDTVRHYPLDDIRSTVAQHLVLAIPPLLCRCPPSSGCAGSSSHSRRAAPPSQG